MHTKITLFLTLALLALTGCASTQTGAGAKPDPIAAQQRALETLDPTQLTTIDGATGEPMTWSEVVERAAEADVVFIGEMHGHPVGLAAAAALFDEVVALTPHSAALSMEFFERDEQAALDDYLTGVTDEDAFREASRRTNGNYPPGHRAMVVVAKSAGVPVYAANAPRQYVRLARLEGFERLEELTPEQRRLFAIPDELSVGRYRDRFFDVMGGMRGHSDEGDSELTEEERAAKEAEQREMILSFFRSQNVWDATMAETIAWALDDGRHPVVHVVGQFHSDFAGGTLERLRLLAPEARILTISMVNTAKPAMRTEDEERADVLIHVGE